jgi:periplasmic protein TonB
MNNKRMVMKNFIVLTITIAGFLPGAYAQEKVVVEKFAQFPGGGEKFFEYIKKEVQYPPDARKDSLTGDVHVEFVVTSNGEILQESVKVVQGLSSSCDAEALRVIKKAPKWIAGSSKTAAIEQKITFPVSFVFK